jgi:hypothetical protein
LLIHTTRRNTAMLKAATQRGAVFEFDLSEADGVIETPRASWRSHLREAMFEERGVLRWAMDRARRNWLRLWGLGPRDGNGAAAP